MCDAPGYRWTPNSGMFNAFWTYVVARLKRFTFRHISVA